MLSGLRERLFSSSSAAAAAATTTNDNDAYMDAGARRLDKHQRDWRSMRDLCESNGKAAERVDAAIDLLVRCCDRHRDGVDSVVVQLSSLPTLQDAMRQLTAGLEFLESSFADTERLLVALEDTIEVQRLQARQLDERFQLALYKERKTSLLETFGDELAAEREARRDAIEARRCSTLRERQQAFGEAFDEEMQHYKQHGHVEKVSVRGGGASEDEEEDGRARLKLEDVEIEDDDALDEFLATEDAASVGLDTHDRVDDDSSASGIEDNGPSSCTDAHLQHKA